MSEDVRERALVSEGRLDLLGFYAASWELVTDVSGEFIGPIYVDCLILEDGTDSLYQNVGN